MKTDLTAGVTATVNRPTSETGSKFAGECFSYDKAFTRNIGIVSPKEQEKLRKATVAFPGMGGVGSIYGHAMSRLGLGNYRLADGDTFDVVNFNRQLGGNLQTVGKNKAESVAGQIHNVNPEANIKIWNTYIDETNIDEFFDGVDLVINGVELFSIPAQRLLLRKAQEKGIPLMMAAPFGLTTALTIFDPKGMKGDDYFDWYDNQDYYEAVANFVLGLAPKRLHGHQIDMNYVDVTKRYGPSHIAACLMCAAVISAEATKILLNWPGQWSAPYSMQWDAETGRVKKVKLRKGNRGWLQKLKKKYMVSQYKKLREEAEKKN